MKKWKVCAMVPTYNRKELVAECLECILKQSVPVESIVLIDNVSIDGTHEYLEQKGLLANPKIEYTRLPPPNKGSAGSYYEGIKRARDKDVDFVWLMDDDLFVKENTLEKLLEASEIVEAAGEKASYFASTVYTPNGNIGGGCDLNIRDKDGKRFCWYRYLDKGLVGIDRAVPLSLLIPKEAIVRCGNYCKHYFMWGEDTEYTLRLAKHFASGYLVGASVATHRKVEKGSNPWDEKDKERLKNRYYAIRNDSFNGRFYRHHSTVAQFYRTCRSCLKFFGKPNGTYLAFQNMRGYIASLFCHKRFARYIENELEQGRKAWEEQYGAKEAGV